MDYDFVYSQDGEFCIRRDQIKSGFVLRRLPNTSDLEASYLIYVVDLDCEDHIMGRFPNCAEAEIELEKLLPRNA